MNAPFRPSLAAVRATSLAEVDEVRRIEAFVAGHPDATPFHRPAWLLAAARGTGNRARAVLLERGWELTGYLPLLEVHSPLFGGMLASSGFGVMNRSTAATPMLRAATKINPPSSPLEKYSALL